LTEFLYQMLNGYLTKTVYLKLHQTKVQTSIHSGSVDSGEKQLKSIIKKLDDSSQHVGGTLM